MNGLDVFSSSWFLASAAVLLATFIRGVTGFGQNLVLAPVLLFLIAPKAVVATNLILAIASGIMLVRHALRHFEAKTMLPQVLGALAGIPLGTGIIKTIDASMLKVLIGMLTLLFAIPIALGLTVTFKRERLAAGLSGLIAGVLMTSTSLGGPPVILFMLSQRWSKDAVYCVGTLFGSCLGAVSLGALAVSGLVEVETVVGALSLLPILIAGVSLGRWAFSRLNLRLFRLFGIAVVIASGVAGVLSGLGLWS